MKYPARRGTAFSPGICASRDSMACSPSTGPGFSACSQNNVHLVLLIDRISERGNVKRVRLDDTLLSLGLHCNSNHRRFYTMSLREIDGFRVTRIRVPRDTQPGIVGQHAFDAFRHLFRSFRDGDLSGMLRITEAHAAAIVTGHPRSTARCIDRSILQRPYAHD